MKYFEKIAVTMDLIAKALPKKNIKFDKKTLDTLQRIYNNASKQSDKLKQHSAKHSFEDMYAKAKRLGAIKGFTKTTIEIKK
jgi:glutamine synthetase type III